MNTIRKTALALGIALGLSGVAAAGDEAPRHFDPKHPTPHVTSDPAPCGTHWVRADYGPRPILIAHHEDPPCRPGDGVKAVRWAGPRGTVPVM